MRRMILVVALFVGLLSSAHPEGQRRPTLSEDLKAALATGARVRVIVQAEEGALTSLRNRLGRGLRRQLAGALSLDLTNADLNRLLADGGIAHISGDLPVVADMAITNKVTRADKVWAGSSGLIGLLSKPGLSGSGIGVAVIDSGIAEHSALGGRVVARVNLVGHEPNVTGDPFGHGTHIAGIIGGSATAASRVTTAFAGGSAPGCTSSTCACSAATARAIRATSSPASTGRSPMRAGTACASSTSRSVTRSPNRPPPTRSAAPSRARCRPAWSSSSLPATTAGRPTGTPILGGITSPGNSPWAITVGALDTAGTVDRGDDRVAPYSSRGPTRFDFAVKPDVVAPGSGIVSLENPGSWLSTRYPSWHIAGSGKNAYYRLSGTSMSAAVVSGGIALLLDGAPGLTPAQIKVALQTGAEFLPEAGLIAGGAGSVDFSASQRLAQGGLLGSTLTTLTNTLGLSGGASYRDTGSLIERVYDRTGVRLLSLLDLQWLLGHADNAEWGVLNLLGLSNPLGSVAPNYLIWGTVSEWSTSYYLIWGTAVQNPEGEYLIWGTSDDSGEYLIWGTGIEPGRDK